MEYLQVFDKNKNKLDEKISRKNKEELEEGKYFMVVLIFIENSDNKYLMQKTSKQKHSCIATTGGHVSVGDDGLTTALKEVKEELGLNLKKEDLKIIETLYDGDCILETYHLYKDIDINKLTLQKEEVEYVKWFTEEEIRDLIKEKKFRESNIKPFEHFIKYKTKKS